MSDNNEIDLYEFLQDCTHWVKRLCKAVVRFIQGFLRLCVRKWWIVLPIILLAVGAALYYSRLDNRTYKVNAIAVLNGFSTTQFEQVFSPLYSTDDTLFVYMQVRPDEPIMRYISDKTISRPRTFSVIDYNCDSTIDMVDYKHKIAVGDTTIMHDHIAMQFRIKRRNISKLPEVTEALMTYLNSNPTLQSAYEAYLPTLDREVRFNHDQIEKLDSLTSAFYFNNNPSEQLFYKNTKDGEGIFLGERRIHLFLDNIYAHIAHTGVVDQRKQLATAPVVLVNNFVIDPKPVNPPLKCVVLFGLFGWLLGAFIALIIEQRKSIAAWLK